MPVFSRVQLRDWLAVMAGGAGLVAIAGLAALVADASVGEPFTFALSPRVGVDRLTGVFLLTLGLVAAPTLVYARAYFRPIAVGRATAALVAAFLLAMVLVLCARDPVTFLAGWELMTLAPAAAILANRADDVARRTVFVYLAITHVGSVGVWAALLYHPDGVRAQTLVAAIAVAGFGTKAGLMPLHPWLPRAHPIAPAPVSALMSGVMVAVAVYGLLRVLADLRPGHASAIVGLALMGLGATSAVGGAVSALLARDLKRILAFSTIENVGVVVTALGAALLLRHVGQEAFARLALAGALLHVLTHGAAKALMFLAAGAIERGAGSVDLDQLGGLLRRMPRTGTAFLIGAASLAALPPLGGFVSEWIVLRSLVALVATGGAVAATAGALALVALGVSVGIAAFCFLRVAGLVLAGPARSEASASAVEPPPAIVAAVVFLAGVCVVLGLAVGVVAPVVAETYRLDLGSGVALALPGTGSLAPIGLFVGLVTITTLLVRARRGRSAPTEPTWVCGHELEQVLLVTSDGFVNPLRLVLGTCIAPSRAPSIERHVYRPVVRAGLRSAAVARRLQGGSLGVYVTYLIGLLVTLLAAARLGWFG